MKERDSKNRTPTLDIEPKKAGRFVLLFHVSNVRERIRTPDTLVRSQVLYPAELRTRIMPVTGVEPVLYRYNRILSPARLPIPPHGHAIFNCNITTYNIVCEKWDL